MTSLLEPAAAIGFNAWVCAFLCFWLGTSGSNSITLASGVFTLLLTIEFIALAAYCRRFGKVR
jgi:hypothetical protein